MRNSSRFSCSWALLKRHIAECSPPSTHNLEKTGGVKHFVLVDLRHW